MGRAVESHEEIEPVDDLTADLNVSLTVKLRSLANRLELHLGAVGLRN
jgi:hypothetical protein